MLRSLLQPLPILQLLHPHLRPTRHNNLPPILQVLATPQHPPPGPSIPVPIRLQKARLPEHPLRPLRLIPIQPPQPQVNVGIIVSDRPEVALEDGVVR